VFPKILRQLRLEQKLTQSDMAKRLNISRVAYTNYELGNREPDFTTITCIANILGTTVDYLLGNSAEPAPAHAKPSGALPETLRLITLSAAGLSRESFLDLQKYIELLKIKEKSLNRRPKRRYSQAPKSAHHLQDKNEPGGQNPLF
jgi:transcriptional regulator with XRE-family HTH domain